MPVLMSEPSGTPETPEPTGLNIKMGCGMWFFVSIIFIFTAILSIMAVLAYIKTAGIQKAHEHEENAQFEAEKKALAEKRRTDFAVFKSWLEKKEIQQMPSRRYAFGNHSLLAYYENEVPEPIIRLVEEIQALNCDAVMNLTLCQAFSQPDDPKGYPVKENPRDYPIKRCRVLVVQVIRDDGYCQSYILAAWNSKNPRHFAIGGEDIEKLLDEYRVKPASPEDPK